MKSNLNPEYALEVRKILGNHFKEVRISKKLTQVQLAQKMGIESKTVSKIEKGVWNFSLDFLILFVHHLDLYLFLPEKSSEDDLVKLMIERHSRKSDKN
jgi:DNA-binding XRE family transcriptional regulator